MDFHKASDIQSHCVIVKAGVDAFIMATGLCTILLMGTYGLQAAKDIMRSEGRLYNLPFPIQALKAFLNAFLAFCSSRYRGSKSSNSSLI